MRDKDNFPGKQIELGDPDLPENVHCGELKKLTCAVNLQIRLLKILFSLSLTDRKIKTLQKEVIRCSLFVRASNDLTSNMVAVDTMEDFQKELDKGKVRITTKPQSLPALFG